MKNIINNSGLRLSAIILAGLFVSSFLLPPDAWAYRKSAGGGKEESFDAGTFAAGTAIGIGSSVAGSAISSGVGNLFGNTSGFSAISSLGGWAGSYGNTVASGQVGRAIYAAGGYAGLGGQALSGLSTLGSSLSSGLISGAPGTIPESLVKSGIIYVASDSKGEYSPWVGVAAGIAGDFSGGLVSHAAVGDVIQGIPSHMVGLVASDMTKGKSTMDRYVINQAFSGAYTAAGGIGGNIARKLDINTSSSIGASGVKGARDANERSINDYDLLGFRIKTPIKNGVSKITVDNGVGPSSNIYESAYGPAATDLPDTSPKPEITKEYPSMVIPQVSNTGTAIPEWQTSQWQYDNFIRNGASPEDAKAWSGYSPPQSTTQQANEILPAVSQSYPLPEAYLPTNEEEPYQVKAPVGLIRPLEFKPNISPPSKIDTRLPTMPSFQQESSLFQPVPLNMTETDDSSLTTPADSQPDAVQLPSTGVIRPLDTNYANPSPSALKLPLPDVRSLGTPQKDSYFKPTAASGLSEEGIKVGVADSPATLIKTPDTNYANQSPSTLEVPLPDVRTFSKPVSSQAEQTPSSVDKDLAKMQAAWGESEVSDPGKGVREWISKQAADFSQALQHKDIPSPKQIKAEQEPWTVANPNTWNNSNYKPTSPEPVNFWDSDQKSISPFGVSPNQPAIATVAYDSSLAVEGGSWAPGQPIYKEGTDKVLYESVPLDYNGPKTRFPILNSENNSTYIYVRSSALDKNDTDAEAFNWSTLPIRTISMPTAPAFASRDSLTPPQAERTSEVTLPSEELIKHIAPPGYRPTILPVAIAPPNSARSSYFEPTLMDGSGKVVTLQPAEINQPAQAVADVPKSTGNIPAPAPQGLSINVDINNAAAEMPPGNYVLTTVANDPEYGEEKHGPLNVTLEKSDDNKLVVYQDYGGKFPVGSVDTILPKERGSVLTLVNPSSGKVYEVSKWEAVSGGSAGVSTKVSENDWLAKVLNFRKVSVDREYSHGDINVYSSDTLQNLGPGEVLVKGPSTLVPALGGEYNEYKDTYYVADINKLPSGYVLSGAGEINIGGVQKTEGESGLPVLDANNVPVYNIKTIDDAMAYDKQQDSSGIFKYDFKLTPVANSSLMSAINRVATAATSNEAIMGHITMNRYIKSPDTTLAQFGDFGKSVPMDLPDEQREKSVYDYVNKAIQYQDPFVSSVSARHTLEEAVASGQGVCRDKAAALEYGLEAAGISAARVVTPSHVFVAVLNSDGSANHYLDPMYYENYVPLQRPNVTSGQIIHNNYTTSFPALIKRDKGLVDY